MFGWFRKRKPKPPVPPAEPASASSGPAEEDASAEGGMEAVRGRVSFASSRGSWTEEFDVIRTAARAFHQRGYEVSGRDDLLEHASGLIFRPLLVHLQPLEGSGGVSTTTIIETRHPDFPADRIYEYQHSTGATIEESLFKGIDQWLQIDFPVFVDALGTQPAQCTYMQMDLSATGDAPARRRRVVLGPVAHMLHPAAPPAAEEQQEPHSSSCPCCLLTNSYQAFKSLIESDGFYAIRLFAMRDEDGRIDADCRINGEEFEPGKEALRQYARKWPVRGVEFRKQYVIVQNAPVLTPEGV